MRESGPPPDAFRVNVAGTLQRYSRTAECWSRSDQSSIDDYLAPLDYN